jgi:mRNA-degrading endonuclease RelE of RelBE toxin-antitoxin system
MEVEYHEFAIKELEKISNPLNKQFGKHIEKLLVKNVNKHLNHGLSFFVEKVTNQARIVYYIKNETIFIFHCFSTHKEYEAWYKSYK